MPTNPNDIWLELFKAMLADEKCEIDDAFIASMSEHPAHIAEGRGFDTENIPGFGLIEVDVGEIEAANRYNRLIRRYTDE